VRQCEIDAERVGEGGHAFCAAGIFGDDDAVFPVCDVFADPSCEGGFGKEVVAGDGEEALYLGRVEVHCDDVVYSGHRQEVCDHFVLDRHTRDWDAYFCLRLPFGGVSFCSVLSRGSMAIQLQN